MTSKTILGFLILIFDQKRYSACGDKPSAFFVLRSGGAATISPCRSSMALNYELSDNISETSIWTSQEAITLVLLFAHTTLEGASRSTVSNGLRSLLAFNEKVEVPVLTTTMVPLTAIISTSNHFPDVRPCFCSDHLVIKTLVLLLLDREEQTSFLEARSRRMSSRCWTSYCVFIANL